MSLIPDKGNRALDDDKNNFLVSISKILGFYGRKCHQFRSLLKKFWKFWFILEHLEFLLNSKSM